MDAETAKGKLKTYIDQMDDQLTITSLLHLCEVMDNGFGKFYAVVKKHRITYCEKTQSLVYSNLENE